MKTVMRALLTGVAFGVLVLVPMSAAQESNEADVAAIQDIWTTYAGTRVGTDAEAWLSLWDQDALKMTRGAPNLTLDEMRAGAARIFAPGGLAAMAIDAEETVVMGDWAFSRGEFSVTPVIDGKEVPLDGAFMTVLKRQDDESWKIYRDIAYVNQ
jgi:ketosteroid isomerase-like protein